MPSRFTGRGFQHPQRRFGHLRFRVHFQPCRSCRPSVIAAQQVLFRRRNVAITAIGQLDHHRLFQRALILQLQSGQCIRLGRHCRDRNIAQGDPLHNDFPGLHLMQVNLLAGINLFACLGQSVAHFLNDPLSPLQ